MIQLFAFRNTYVDNWELTIKAADCDYVNNELVTMDAAEKTTYLNDFCV